MKGSFKYIRFISLFCCCLVAGNFLLAQEKNSWQLSHILNADNGLSQNSVNDLYFDQQSGFLWIATEGGLVRYSGTSTKIFEITNIPAFKQARMIVFSKTIDNRVMIFDRSCYAVFLSGQTPDKRYSLPFCEVISAGFFRSPLTTAFQRNPSFQTLVDSGVKKAYQKIIDRVNPASRTKNMAISYINDSTGLVLDDSIFIVGKQVYPFKVEGPDDYRRYMHFSSLNKIVILYPATLKGYLLDTDKKTMRPIAYSGGDLPAEESYMFCDQVNEDNFIIRGKKIYRFLLKNEKLETELVAELPEVPDDISKIAFNEKDGRIYIGTKSKGLYIFVRSFFHTYRFNDQTKFKGKEDISSIVAIDNSYASALIDSNHVIVGILPAGAVSRTLLFNLKDGKFDLPATPYIGAFNFTIDKHRKIYGSDGNKLMRYAYSSGRLTTDAFDINLGVGNVSCYYDEKLDRVWVVDVDKKDIFYIYQDSLYRYANVFAEFGMSGTVIIKRTNNILIAFSPFALYRINEQKHKLEKIYSFDVSSLRDVYIDQDNLVWISTYGKGLIMHDLKTGQSYSPKNDTRGYLRFNHCVVDDGAGNFYIPTNNGLFQINRKSLIETYKSADKPLYYYYFDKTNGLQQNEFNGGAHPAFTKTPNGDILLPTIQGLVHIPASMSSASAGYPLFVQEVKTQKQAYEFGENMVFDKDERTITWEVNFAQWKHPFTSSLAYQFDGQTTWTDLEGEERKILITELTGGRHQLRIRNQFDLKGDKISVLVINFQVRKKYYEKPWFWIGLLGALFFAIYAFTAFRHRQLQVKNRRLEGIVLQKTEAVRSKNADLEKALGRLEDNSKFQQNLIGLLGHDIMVPLQYIGKVSRQLIFYRDKLKEETRTETIQEIGNTANQLLYMGESIIHWVKIHEGDFILKYSPFNLYDLVEDLRNLHHPIAAEKGNLIKNEVPRDLDCIHEPVIIRIVLHNLLLNSNKFTTKGNITINAELRDDILDITLSDTGIGMNSETLAALNAYQAVTSQRGTGDEKGWGLGYRFIIELVRFINGKLFIQSEKGKGTQVTIRLKCAE